MLKFPTGVSCPPRRSVCERDHPIHCAGVSWGNTELPIPTEFRQKCDCCLSRCGPHGYKLQGEWNHWLCCLVVTRGNTGLCLPTGTVEPCLVRGVEKLYCSWALCLCPYCVCESGVRLFWGPRPVEFPINLHTLSSKTLDAFCIGLEARGSSGRSYRLQACTGPCGKRESPEGCYSLTVFLCWEPLLALH